MKSQEQIYNLIKSMDKQEKWYFKQFAKWNAIKGSSNYIQLFDELNSQKTFEESVIKKKLQKKMPSFPYAETKYQLFKNILKSLHFYHLNSSIDARVKLQIHQVEILFYKTQYKEALKLLDKTKQEAIRYEKFALLLDLLEWERLCIIYSHDFSKMEEDINRIYDEIDSISRKLTNLNAYTKLNNQLYIIHTKSGVVRNDKMHSMYLSVIKNKLLKDIQYADSYEAKAMFYHCYKTYWFAVQNYKEYYLSCKMQLEVLEEKPYMINLKLTRYLGALYAFGLAQIDVEDYENFPALIQKMRNVDKLYPEGKHMINQYNIFDLSYRLELRYYNVTKQFDKGNSIIKTVQSGLKKFKSQLSESSEILIYYELSLIKFGRGEYQSSLDYIDYLIQQNKSENREDVMSMLRILQLILHFELGNEWLLPYVIKSTYRYLYKKERLFKVETIVLNYLRKLNKIQSRKQLIHSLVILRKELVKLNTDTYEKIGLEYIDFIGWLDHKIDKYNLNKHE